ncbi:hypothetical protein ARSEF4850_008456 [Beauveria asiatica]
MPFLTIVPDAMQSQNLEPNCLGYSGRGLAFADTSKLNIYNGVDFAPFEQRFNGSLFKRSPYSGPPSPEMDKTWGRFTEMGSNDARASTSYSLETAVHLEETQNIGYMASLGFFHQIHCLNMLRKFIHLDYYKEKTPDWFSQPYLRAHADHCVDMIREAIMCHGDTSLIVYHWIDGYNDPVPDFSTMHTCPARSNEAPEYQKLAVDEELAGDKSEYKWKTRFQAMTAVYVVTTLCLVAVYCLYAKNNIGVDWALPSDVIFGHSGGGLIAVPDARKLGLVGGLPLGKAANEERPREGYGISMFHQIHCLVAIRTAIRTRTFNDQHLDHCLDYLRQAIMCTGDTTLEKVIADDNGKFKPEIDGWGTVHECRSWHMLFEFAERQRA